MGEDIRAEKAPKKSWFKGLKSEFKKIVWPDRKSILKQTAVVVAISVFLGILISLLDSIIGLGIEFILR